MSTQSVTPGIKVTSQGQFPPANHNCIQYSLTKLILVCCKRKNKKTNIFPRSLRNTEVRKSKSSPTEWETQQTLKVQETKMGPACSSISRLKDLCLKIEAKTST